MFILIPSDLDWPQNNNMASNRKHDNEAKSKFEKSVGGKFTGNYEDDGVSGEFDGLTYSHSQEMLKVRHSISFFIRWANIIYYTIRIIILTHSNYTLRYVRSSQ